MSTYYCANCLTTFTDDGERCSNLGCGSRRPGGGWGLLLGPGDLLDRHYRIDRPLAVGGAGLTYLAREVDTNGVAQPPDLAIKVLYAARAAGAFLHRLSTEAQILQELNHDNIVQLRGFVHRAGQEPYLVTLYEHGGNLTELVEQHGALPTKVAAGILSQVLSALDVAHQRGVVHRDLKPDNVLLRERVDAGEVPHVRVADFGIAKVSGALGNVTKHGTFVGTPEYAAPEQFEGMDPTPATDVFAAGALFVHLLTGQMPIAFSTRTDIKTCRDEWLAALPPRLEPGRLHGADAVELVVLQEILDHMMDVRPERRWTVQRVLSRLDGLVHGNAELRQRETLELTGKPAPSRDTLPPEVLAEPTAAVYLDDEDAADLPRKAEPTSEVPGDVDDAPTERPYVPTLDQPTEPVLARPAPDATPDPTPDAPAPDGPPAPPVPIEPPAPPPPETPVQAELPVVEVPPEPPERPVSNDLYPEIEPSNEGSGIGGCFAALAGLGVAGVGVLAVGAVLVVLLLVGVAWQLGYFASGPRTVVITAPKPGPQPKPGNPQPGNPEPGNPQPGNPEPGNPQPGTPEPGTPEPGTPEPGNPEPGNPQPGNPEPGNPQPNPVPAPTGTPADPGARIASTDAAWGAVRDAFDAKRPAVEQCGAKGFLVGTAWLSGGQVTAVRLDPGYAVGDPKACVEGALAGTAVAGEGWVRFGI